MITDQLIRNKFIADVMSQGINKIYETQENVVRTYLNTRSGDLVAHLQRRLFTSQGTDNNQVYYMRIFPYLRFLDINYRRGSDRISRHIRSNLALYNRVVWGVLYHETFPEIKYGYTQEIRSSIRQELEQALEQPSN
ncbi:MAG: hypothetical protein KH897_02645 [Bacteroides sp.]|uniref:hypothetical protein n=1 Tax=Bacteroides sp. TaxID=29523 RepID=UPI0025C2ADAE|nr:hypothetical protein [Bacteroides sp.]MBS6237281.1 hypothetical protein [Bacteroides sp.]